MNNFRLLPEKSNARHLFVEITTDALEKSGIPKGTNVYIRKVKKWKLEQPTAWRMPDGQIRITCAFEDSDNVILYSPKDENLMEMFDKKEVQFLGRVMSVKTNVENAVPKKSKPQLNDNVVSISAGARIFSIKIINDKYAHVGLTVGCLAVGEHGKVKPGEFISVLDLKTNKCYLGFYESCDGGIGLTVGGDDNGLYAFNESHCRIVGKIIGYSEPKSSKILPLKDAGRNE